MMCMFLSTYAPICLSTVLSMYLSSIKAKGLVWTLYFYNQQNSQKLWKSHCNYLGLFHRSCVFITHWADLHPPLPLFVSLLEKFFHDAVCPLTIQLQGLGGVAQVCTVYHVAKDLQMNWGNLIKLRVNTARTPPISLPSTLGTKFKNILVAW